MPEIFTATAIHEIDGKYTIIETSSLNELKQDLTRTREQLANYETDAPRVKMLEDTVDLYKQQLTIAREALEGFSKFCIKPECVCFACTALKKLNTPMPMGEEER